MTSEEFRAIRRQLGLTQTELAAKLRRDHDVVSLRVQRITPA